MKKHLLFSAALSLMATAGVQAQDLSDYKYYDFGETTWVDPDGYENPYVCGYFNKVSANGKYAVGYDEEMFPGLAYKWCSDNPEALEFVSTDYNKVTLLYDAANDGTCVGGFTSDADENVYPGILSPAGEWTTLPVPEDYSVQAANSQSLSSANAVTPDGSHVAGQYYVVIGETESPFGGMTEIRQLVPALWTKNGDAYELTEYRDLGKAGNNMLYDATQGGFADTGKEVAFNTFFVYDISNDGKTIVGVNTSDTGGQNPAFIRDDKLMQLYDCADESTYTFNGGICNSIDADGNIYGYFTDDELNTTYFVYTADGKLEYADKLTVCGTADGVRFGQQTGSLAYTMDCSEDGSVIVGGGVLSFGFGVANCPAVLVKKVSTGIGRAERIAQAVNVNYGGGVLVVTGEYDRAELYNAAGTLVAGGGQGKAFSLAGQPAGTYIVKVTTADGVKSFKFAR